MPLRTVAQILAGVVVVIFGLAQLGVPGFKDITVSPPATWGRWVRGRTRSQSALAPTALGLASVLIPCGVTLSVEADDWCTPEAVIAAITEAGYTARLVQP